MARIQEVLDLENFKRKKIDSGNEKKPIVAKNLLQLAFLQYINK